jgi:hypothetical protein
MTPQELERIERLIAEATPGPWRYGDEREESIKVFGPEGGQIIAYLSWSSTPPRFDDDAKLIVALANNAPAIIRKLKAADKLAEAWNKNGCCHFTREYCQCLESRDAALEAYNQAIKE